MKYKVVLHRFEELDVKVKEYRRRMREVGDVVSMSDGITISPRDSPITSTQATITDSTVTVTNK